MSACLPHSNFCSASDWLWSSFHFRFKFAGHQFKPLSHIPDWTQPLFALHFLVYRKGAMPSLAHKSCAEVPVELTSSVGWSWRVSAWCGATCAPVIYLAWILARLRDPSTAGRSACQTYAAGLLLSTQVKLASAVFSIGLLFKRSAPTKVGLLPCQREFASLSAPDLAACRSYTSWPSCPETLHSTSHSQN